MNSRCWPRTVNVSPRTSRNAHPPFLQAFEGTPGRLPPGGLFYARKKVVLLVFGAPYPRRGAMVVPSGIAQAFPGRSHLAIHGQIGPSRHHHCPAHWAAEPPRVRKTSRTFLRSGVCGGESSKEHRARVCPSRTVFGQGWPKRSAAAVELTGMMRWTPLANTASRCAKIELPKPIDYKRCPHERYLDRD